MISFSQVALKAKGTEVTCYTLEDAQSFAVLGYFTYSKFWNHSQNRLPNITELQAIVKACFQNQAKTTDD